MRDSAETISPFTATIITMNAMIGAGIFSVPIALQLTAGPIGLITCIVITAAVWCLALSLTRVAEQRPHATSFYHYIAPWGGHTTALIITALYTTGMIVGMSLLTRTLGLELAQLFPFYSATSYTGIILVLLATITMHGITLSTVGQKMLIVGTVAPLVIITFICFLNGSINNLTPFAPQGMLPALFATKTIIFGFFGFECVTVLAPLIKDSAHKIPWIVTGAVTCVGLLYFAFITSIMYAIPTAMTRAADGSLITILLIRFPEYVWLMRAVTLAILSAIIGTIHAMLWSMATLIGSSIYAENQQRTIFIRSLIIGSMACLIFTLSRLLTNLNFYFSITALCVVPAYFCSVIAIFAESSRYSRTTKWCAYIGLLATTIIACSALYDLTMI